MQPFFIFLILPFLMLYSFYQLGSIIRSLDYKSDIRKMGGLRKKMPITYIITIGLLL